MNRGIIRAWILYDWANSAFATTVMAALFPPFYRSLVTAAGGSAGDATAYWGYTTSVALLLVALGAPVLGAVADQSRNRKRYLTAAAGLGICATAAFATIGPEDWRWASLLFVTANVGFAGSIIFYESLLPHITTRETIDRVSSRGYACGYLGGGLLLILNLAWISHPQLFGMPGTRFAVQASFLSVALWWALFSIPLWRRVPEPPPTMPPQSPAMARQPPTRASEKPGRFDAARLQAGSTGAPAAVPALVAGFRRLRSTLRAVRHYRQLFLFLIAFWCYSDGIGTIIKMATAYGDEIGISLTDMTTALVLTQFVGLPCTLLFGRLAGRLGAQRSILLGLVVYALICIGGFFMRTAFHFYLLALMVGTVQGGCQALSRSLFGRMVPRARSAEFFGFFSTSSKFAGIAGPLLFGVVSHATGASRLSILAILVFFLAGGLLLSRVDVAAGIRAAEREPARGRRREPVGPLPEQRDAAPNSGP